ncbi:MAG: cyclic pyranopterin monophosphate synthase MoaC [Armatimonadota bacterium]
MDKTSNPPNLSHVDEHGKASMVDVSEKPVTARYARAMSSVIVQESTLEAIIENRMAKGDVLAVARIAGIMAAKRCGEMIPLCHNIQLDVVEITFDLCPGTRRVDIESIVTCHGKTGIEMEALLAVSIAALTVYDMVKAVDRTAVISDICLMEKSGGKSGHFIRKDDI